MPVAFELRKLCNTAAVVYFINRMCFDGLRKTTKNSNTGTLEYGAGGLTYTTMFGKSHVYPRSTVHRGQGHIGSITNVNCCTCCSGNNNLIKTSFTCNFISK
jgi:hypothetical protein